MIVVSEMTERDALVPLIVTDFVPLKPLPVIVICVPIGPDAGRKLVTTGGGGTTKGLMLATVPPGPAIAIGPVVDPAATTAAIFLCDLITKPCAAVPLNVTAVTPVK